MNEIIRIRYFAGVATILVLSACNSVPGADLAALVEDVQFSS